MILHYSFAIRLLHWLTLLALLAAYGSIESRSWIDLTPEQRKMVAFTHVYAGMSVLIMMVTRLFLRAKRALQGAPSRQQARLAQWGHGILYLLFVTLPLLSLTARYFRGREWSWLGFTMPISDTPNPALAKTLMSWHVDLAQLGYWLIAAHTLAALYHHVVKKDNTLRAMRLWGK